MPDSPIQSASRFGKELLPGLLLVVAAFIGFGALLAAVILFAFGQYGGALLVLLFWGCVIYLLMRKAQEVAKQNKEL